jgi:ABC-type sugar transport system substrate-binding protein
VVGTLIGALIMGTLRNGLNQLDVPGAWEGVVVGAVLVAAVVIDRARHRAPAAAQAARRWRRRIALAAVAVALLGGAAAYRLHSDSAASSATATIAFVPKSIDSSFWVDMQHAAEAEAARHGARVITLAPDRETDVEAQFRIIENMVERRVDAILLAPAGSKEMLSAIAEANRAGVPVLIVDSDIDRAAAAAVGATTATFIGSDNYRGGQLAGEYLVRALGSGGKVAIVEGTAGHESTDQRQRGFRDALAAAPAIAIVAAQPANGERARAYSVMQNILQAHPDLAAVFGANDEMALGAAEAVDAAGKLAQVRVIGFDATAEALVSIRAGRMLGSVAQYPTEMGRIGVASAMELLRGGTIEPLIHTEVRLIDRAAAEALEKKTP